MVPFKTLIIVSTLFGIIAGCTTIPNSTFCDIEKPNRDPVEDMTPTEARTALEHNLTGAKLCGWRP